MSTLSNVKAVFLFCIATLAMGVVVSAATTDGVRALVRSGHITEALREMRDLERENPNDPNLQFEIGELLQELAASRAERLQKLAPDSAQVHELIGKSLESHQKAAEALAEYELAARADPSLPGIHFLIGNLFWKQRDFAAAKPALESELALNPSHAFANLRMGEILLVTDADAPLHAIPYLKKAVADSHTGLEAHRELGRALRMAHQYQEAFQELQLVVKERPDDERVHAQLAALYRDRGDSQNARKELEIQRRILQTKREASLKARETESKP